MIKRGRVRSENRGRNQKTVTMILLKQILFLVVLSFYCGHIMGQTDSLYEKSVSRFHGLDVNAQLKEDTVNNEQLYYIRQCYSINEDFSRILSSISELAPYTLIYRVIFREIDNKNFISFVQCKSCDNIINEMLDDPKVTIPGCIIVNNAIFYIFNMQSDNSTIDRLISRSDSYNVITKINYPEEDGVFFVYRRSLPMYVEEDGHIFEYK